jgi:threonine synthase
VVISCAGCGWPAPPGSDTPFRCPRAGRPGDDVDHVLVRRLPAATAWPESDEPNPFLRYRTLLAAHGRATSDAEYVEIVRRLDEAIAGVDGAGFSLTPFQFDVGLDAWVKDETGGVGGSHKGRHLMGLAIWLEVVEIERTRPLAIASCGNAALAAAVIARAAARPLRVFVPTWSDEHIVARLRELGAEIEICPREDDDPPGDPCVLRFREAVAAGAIAFSCQGPDNGLTIDGGRTLGYELADAGLGLDHLVVQVGGGALASSVGQGLSEAVALGRLATVPTIHVVQSAVHAPMVRAWQRRRPQWRSHRHELMWPWEPPGSSIATGILDDETYDWAAVLELLEVTGGHAIAVSEDELGAANEKARRSTGIDVSPTGSAGVAGLDALRRDGVVSPDRTVAVLCTG